MRLERGDDATAGERRARGRECRADLGRMVSVVIHHIDSVDRSKTLEAPLDTAKRGEAGTHRLERGTKGESARNRGQRVHHVMQPRYGQLDFAEHLVIELDLEDRPAAFGSDVDR